MFPILYAQTAAAPGASGAFPPQLMILMFVVFGGMIYFQISSQRKRDRERKNLLESIAKGDSVVTIGGAVGTVHHVSESHVVVELDRDVRVKFEKAAIGRIEKKVS